MSPLALRLAELRRAAGLSQTALSDASGVRQATISALETGKARRIDFTTVERLAKALQVDPHAMFTTEPKRRR